MVTNPIPFIGIVGPTAVGKTELSLVLAEKLNGEIISADSMQVYKHMDIGTAKLPMNERRGIPHYMIDVVEPMATYSVHEYAVAARNHLRSIFARGKVPIVVGGTGLYFRALTENFDFTETNRNDELRQELEDLANVQGAPALHQKLAERDPVAANRIHPNDKKRIIRALEIVLQSGRSVQDNYQTQERPFVPILMGLNDERERLYRRIDARVDHMLELGLLDEVRDLMEMGCNESHTAMQAIGYKELLDYFYERITLTDAVATIKTASKRYAKRQLSWFRADKRIWWYHLQEDGMMEVPSLEEKAAFLWLQQMNNQSMAPEDR